MLTRLTCDMWATVGTPLSLTGVPCLERLVLANEAPQLFRPFMLSKLLADATNLRHLSLNFQSEEVVMDHVTNVLFTILVGP